MGRKNNTYWQGRRHEFEGGEVNALKGGGFNTVKTLKFEKGGEVLTLMVAPPLHIGRE